MQRKYLINEKELTNLVSDAMILEYIEDVNPRLYESAKVAVADELESADTTLEQYAAFYYQRALKEEK